MTESRSPLPAAGDQEGRIVGESPVRPSEPIVNQHDGEPRRRLDVDEILRRSEPKIKHCVFKAAHGR